MCAARALLPDGRWHFQHGPIDLVIGAEGPAAAVAHEDAWRRFEPILPALVAELPLLRLPVQGACGLQGAIAQRMWQACRPFATEFITPMAAVAGAVAEAVIAAYARPGITRAWVNNGGDIALHLAEGTSVRVGLVADVSDVALDGTFTVTHGLPVRGIATSGWRGRSFSLGIADAVTVLAPSAAMADAAATMIANAVNVAHPAIERRPANALKDDTDLGERLVTVNVHSLPPQAVQQALQAGAERARTLQAQGLVHAAVLACQGRMLTVQPAEALACESPA